MTTSLLQILEVRANLLSSLHTLTAHPPPPRLQYLGLGSNALGSHTDAARLTGRHWLVCAHTGSQLVFKEVNQNQVKHILVLNAASITV